MSEREEQPRSDDAADAPDADESRRDEVAGRRDGQPGYDLDEGAAYENADGDAG